MRTWDNIAWDLQTEIGYSRKKSDKWWIIVTHPGLEAAREGYSLANKTASGWHLDLADDTLVFPSYKQAKIYVANLPQQALTGPMNLGDYWRYGDTVPMHFAASRRIVAKIIDFNRGTYATP